MKQNTKLVIFFVALVLFDQSFSQKPKKSRKGNASSKPLSQSDSKGSPAPACTLHSSSGKFISSDYCTDSTTPLCGVDPKTGYGQGCVSASQCPPNVDNETMVCDSSKAASCCCKERSYDFENYDYELDELCNDLLNQEYDDFWKQACKLQELMSLPLCTGPSPALSLFCAKSEDNEQNEGCPLKRRYCGIDRQTGKLQGCVSQAQCPGNVNDRGIVCQADKSSCCCLGKSDPLDKQLACNNILKDRGTSNIWKQACGLPELKALPVCEKLTTTTEPPEPPFPEKCLAYCKETKRRHVKGPFEINCGFGYGGDGSKKYQCEGDCPQECLCHNTGSNLKLKCPELPPEPIKYRTDIETYVAIVLVGLIGLGIIAGIIYAIVMKIKKRKRKQVIGDPFALTRFYQNYPRPPGVVEMAQREESLKAQESTAGTEGQPEAEK